MKHFVTLFDKNYLARGLAMYKSLIRYCEDCHLWAICFDDFSCQILNKLNLPKLSPISLKEFEDAELLKIKPTRSPVEYFWTCTPSTCLYIINHYPEVDNITYLDADLMFFSNPQPIFDEMGNASILLTEHRYLPEFDKTETNGIFNVQFMTFRRDQNGLHALSWWREQCLNWCFNRVEDGKFGDQKYLDEFPKQFNNVHILQNIGGGVAPWNVSQHLISQQNNQTYIDDYSLIFYHFHAFRLYPFKIAYPYPSYPLNNNIRLYIYQPYCQAIQNTYYEIRKHYPGFNYGISNIFQEINQRKDLNSSIREILKGIYTKRYYFYE